MRAFAKGLLGALALLAALLLTLFAIVGCANAPPRKLVDADVYDVDCEGGRVAKVTMILSPGTHHNMLTFVFPRDVCGEPL